LQDGTVYGLAEMMNYPGVVSGDGGVLAKLAAFRGRPIDGHAPAVSGTALNAYVASGIGSEHECTTVAEAQEKLARGLYILIREATNARNLHTLLPLITPANNRRIAFCTDDRIPADLIDQGSIDSMVREAIAFGIDPITALRMATLNTAEWFGLHERGAIAPGRVADLVIVDSLAEFRVRQVYAAGKLVAEDGSLASGVEIAPIAVPENVGGSVRVDWHTLNLRVAVPAGHAAPQIRVIGMIDGQIVTEERICPARVENGQVVADPERDILKMAVVERHRALGSVGLGFIQGMGLTRGAIAGTVAHDHHNLVVIGADDRSMLAAAHAVAEMQGGLAVTEGDEIMASLPLPVGGVMSDQPMATVRAGYDRLVAAAAALGSPLHDPFMAMSFMALEVVPRMKLTDKGLVDVQLFDFVDLFV
jgi:adenine deaminase